MADLLYLLWPRGIIIAGIVWLIILIVRGPSDYDDDNKDNHEEYKGNEYEDTLEYPGAPTS